jgi:hypothetical protein
MDGLVCFMLKSREKFIFLLSPKSLSKMENLPIDYGNCDRWFFVAIVERLHNGEIAWAVRKVRLSGIGLNRQQHGREIRPITSCSAMHKKGAGP